jgi:beta-lactamase superfamily II metal-dependent hydrolase
MRDYLLSVGVSKVDLVVASHNHADHIGGLPAVLRAFRPPFYLDNGVPTTTLMYAGVLAAATEAGSQLLLPTERRISLGDVILQVIPPPGMAAWDQNDNSIGLILQYATFRMSLAGDAEPREWASWMRTRRALISPVDVHKSSHHGSVNGDTRVAMAALSPDIVVVGVGTGNSYGHPAPQALTLYANQGASVLRTDQHGTVIVDVDTRGAYSVSVERGVGARPRTSSGGMRSGTPFTSSPTVTRAAAKAAARPRVVIPVLDVNVAAPNAPAAPGDGAPGPPRSWSGTLPSRSAGSHPLCLAPPLPAVAACVGDRVGAPQAVCNDRAFSCAAGSGTCSGHGGVRCWRN